MRGACARSNKDDRLFQYEEKDDERAIWSAGAGCVGRRVAAGARSRVQAHANGRLGGAHGPGRGQRRARAGDRRHGGKGKAAAGAHAGGQQAGRARGGGRRLPRGEKRRPEHDRPVHRGVAANAPRQRGGENHAPRSDADRAPGAGARGHRGEGRCAVQVVRQLLQKSTGARWAFISFPGGGERIAALLGGHVDIMVIEPEEAGEHIRAGNMRVLAQISEHRLPAFPNVPTLKEAGFDVPVVPQVRGVIAPPGIPKENIEFWEDFSRRLTRTPSWRKYIADNQFEDGYQNAAGLAKFYVEFTDRMRGILKDAGVKTVR